jgi:type IV pilus assembly protein PilY1
MRPSRPLTLPSLPSRSIRFGVAGLLAALCLPSRALAQATEAEKPAPNVLLLVDSSGSMEFKTDGTFPACVPGDSNSEKSRWIDLVEVMTGTFDADTYSCWAQDRSSPGFQSEFSLGGQPPYDFGYVNPYHRALSGNCVYGPGVRPALNNPYDWPDGAVNRFPFVAGEVVRPPEADLGSHVPCATFDQAPDGLLDIYRDQVRFGLMTFDARVGSGTGVTSGLADYVSGMDGNWSYFLGNAPVTGHPANCAFDMVQEVGARNAAAPPWEGRMIAFGPPGNTDNIDRNRRIQEVLLSTRPYGATPIAGQLHDAREFLWNDTSIDPLDSATEFGPTNDPNWRASNCRKTILVLLTDGEPNMDLRPFCSEEPPPPETAGRCPYDTPEDIVRALRLSPPAPALSVETYVIGFALGQVTPYGGAAISCSDLTDVQCSDPANNDLTNYPESTRIQACCTLNKVAAAGGLTSASAPRKAYFAENRAQLRAIFTDILDDVVQVATRTMPVFSSAGGDTQSSGFKFFSAFDPQPSPDSPGLWEGVLERKRFVCSTALVPQERYDPARGDDFASNINSLAGDPRWFYTVIADGDSRNSIRPFMTDEADGLTLADGEQRFANQPSALAPLIPAAKMDVTAATCSDVADADTCRTRIIEHAVGVPNASPETRCPNGVCSLFGGIYHSTPTVVSGRPNEALRDDSYRAFEEAMASAARPTALYTSTVDGFLHAFNLAPYPGSPGALDREIDEQLNNELWAFIPPAVLPVMQAQYPRTPAVLLDGLPVIKDVVAFDDAGTVRFERTQADAQAGGGLWKTVLVQGFGEGQVDAGYFAIDITNPNRTNTPVFRWQLTRNADNTPLFGGPGTPLITTVFLDAALGGPREVPVAVLPGGDAEPTSTAEGTGPAEAFETDPPGFEVLRNGRDYSSRLAARSLTIVRLDTGEVIRTFRPAGGAGPFAANVVTETNIPAPITGQPRAFPELAGAVADRIFVGDRDGRMWRVDVSSQDPDQWTMEVFFDAFYDGAFDSGQPVYQAPVLSVNDDGRVTVAYATGDQYGTGLVNKVISLIEDIQDDEFVTKVNWLQTFNDGERVTGPLVLFNRGLYYAASRMPDTSSSACDVGRSAVYGSHFELSVDDLNGAAVPSPTSGPAPAPGASTPLIASRTDGMIFGVSLEAEPTCASQEEVIDGNTSFGYGSVTMSRRVNPGRFFLTFEVSGSNADARGVLEVRQQLTTPRIPVSFESWALVYE